MKALVVFLFCLLFPFLGTVTAQGQTNGGEDTPRVNGHWFNAGNPFSPRFRGQCTWYVWGRCAEASNGAWLPNYLGNANGWYAGTTNGGAKNQTPAVGAIMCTPDLARRTGHVSYVVQVNNDNSWVIEEYNVVPLKWTRQTITRDLNTGKVRGPRYSWTRLQGFVHPQTALPVSINDGDFVKERSRPECYIIVGGAKIYVPSETELFGLGYLWSQLKIVPDGRLNSVPNIPRDGTMIKDRSADPVWVVLTFYGETRLWYVQHEYQVNRYGGWGSIRRLPDGSLRNRDFKYSGLPLP